jgi:hypothetical protein
LIIVFAKEKLMKTRIVMILLIALTVGACDRVGSEAWCKNKKETPKGEWTLDDTESYAKFCVLGMDSEKWCKDMEKKDKGDWTASEATDYAKNCIVGRSE